MSNIAGMLSAEKIKSVVSINAKTKNKGVAKGFSSQQYYILTLLKYFL
jgi:hypothetical protein